MDLGEAEGRYWHKENREWRIMRLFKETKGTGLDCAGI